MGANIEHQRPAEIVARRVVETRKSRGWTQAKLADRLREVGYDKSRATLTKLEGGRYRNVSVDDMFALAVALGVSPVYLLVPLEDDATVAVAPKVKLPAPVARAWLRGRYELPMLPDVDLRHMPESELLASVRTYLERDMDALTRGLMGAELDVTARRIVEQLRNPPREEE